MWLESFKMVMNCVVVICFDLLQWNFYQIFLITFFFLKFPVKKLESSSVVLVFYHTSYVICQTSTATSTLESSSVTTKKTSRVLCLRNCPYPPPPPNLMWKVFGKLESGVKQSWKFNFNFYKEPPSPWGGGRGARVWITF